MFEHILVAVDGSPTSDRATACAAEVAHRFGAQLSILHVMPRLGSSDVPAELEPMERIEHVILTEADLFRQKAQTLVDAAKAIAADHGLPDAITLIDHGDAAERIIACAKRHDIGLMVVGSRGLGDLTGLLMGSVTHKITHLAHCPYMIVPTPHP